MDGGFIGYPYEPKDFPNYETYSLFRSIFHNQSISDIDTDKIDLEYRDKGGFTALQRAGTCNSSIILKLIRSGADYNVSNDRGWSILHNVSKYCLETVNELLNLGIDIDIRNNDLRTPLMIVSDVGHTVIVKELIDRGASINLTDINGRTALSLASMKGHAKVVKLLL